MFFPQQADLVESFSAKFGRMQDTAGDKLLPLFLQLLMRHGELFTPFGLSLSKPIHPSTGSGRADFKLHLAASIEMLALRNQLVHEYMEDPAFFAGALNRANELADDLFATYRNVWRYCADTLNVDVGLLPSMPQEAL